jgi:hypothetical protein
MQVICQKESAANPSVAPLILRFTELVKDEPVCFVAGTPVWADKGLVPIEKIKVGDLMLSKSDVTGEKAYKRVLQTFRTENQEIRTVNIEGPMNADTAASARGAFVKFPALESA